MKESNITSALVKTKMSGYEVGRLMIQGFLYDLKQLYGGSKDIKDLLTPQEVQHIQDQLTDSQDMKIYNLCRRLWEYLEHASSMATITKKEIDIVALKLYILISGEMKADSMRRSLSSFYENKEINISVQRLESILGLVNIEHADSKDVMVLDLFDEIIDLLKQWLIFQEVFNLISERMELPDLVILVNENPMSKVALVNALIKDLQFLHPKNDVSKALFNRGIGHICGDDEVPENADVIEIEKLKPVAEGINAAREAMKDLTYFKSNWGIHSILGLEANIE